MKTGILFRFRSSLLLCVTLATGAALAQPAMPVAADKTVVVHTQAGDVTVADVKQNLASLSTDVQAELLRQPAQLESLARLIAAQKELLKEADSKAWDRRPEVASAIAVARNDVILRSYLSDKMKPGNDFPSEAEIQEYYKANVNVFTRPRKFHLAHIFVASAEKAADKEKAKAKLTAIEEKLKAPNANFGAIATASSDDKKTAPNQGDIGLVEDAQIEPNLHAAVLTLSKGGVSAPVQLSDGWHIIKLTDIVPPAVQPLSEVHDQIVQALRERRTMLDGKAYLDDLIRKVPPLNTSALDSLAASGSK